MPQVSSGNSELVQQILALAQILGQKKDKQARNILDLALPGQTAEQIGLTPSLSKRAFGRTMAPTDVVKPDTPEAARDRFELQFLNAVAKNPAALDTAQPSDVLSIGATVFANKSAGTPGMTTPQALKSRAATAQTQATTQAAVSKSVLDRVVEGIDSMNRADPATRAAVGQQLAYGTTQEQTAADRFKAQLAAEATKVGIQFIAAPDRHPLGREFRKLGIDPVAAVAAIGTGSLNFLDNIARLAVNAAENQGKTNTALRTAQAQWATRLSESLGNRFSPALIMQVMDRRMAGTPPPKDAKQAAALGQVEAMIDQGMEMAYRVAMTKASLEGDPNVLAIGDLVSAANNIKDDKRYKEIATEIRRRSGRIMLTQLTGPRPLQPGQEQAAWDQTADLLVGLSPTIENQNWKQILTNFIVPPFMGGPRGEGAGTQGPVPTPGTGLPSSINDLSDQDKASVAAFMQAIQATQQPAPTPTP